MKRLIPTSVAVFLAIFLAIAYFKNDGTHMADDRANQMSADASRLQTEQFWQVYRDATDARLAGQFAAAATKYQRALQFDPAHENSLYYLGNMHNEMGKIDSAKATWRQLLEINPSSSRAYVQLGNAYLNFDADHHFDIQQAQFCFEKAMAINAEETGPLLWLGQIALAKGDFEQAKSYFAAVLQSNFKSVEAYYFNGFIAWHAGDFSAALTLFEQAVNFSQSMRPAEAVLGEGDTRPGIKIDIREPVFSKLLLKSQRTPLAKISEERLSQEMAAHYRIVEKILNDIDQKVQRP